MPTDIKRGTFARIRGFVRGDGMRMVFQPIADLDSGSVIGFESLARFDAPPPRSPAAWFDDAQAAGLRRELELATAQAAIDSLDQLPDGAYLTVNASPDVAMSPAFIDVISQVPGARVVVEITEHAPIEDYDAFNEALSALRSRGVRVAIDDTGAGFANMSHILRIDADLIKLDIEITRHIDIDSRRRALVASLVEFARSVGATIVAEGIETEAELQALRSLGVHSGQGYHLGRPAPLPGFATVPSRKPRRRGRFLPSIAVALADARSLIHSRRAARRVANRRRRIFRPAAIALVGALVLAPATMAFADDAAPGTPGYWLNQRVESVRLLVALDRAAELRLRLDFARKRMNVLSELLADGRTDLSAMILAEFAKHVDGVKALLGPSGRAPRGLQARIVRDLSDYVAALDEGRSVLCPAAEHARAKACGSARSAEKRSKEALAHAEKPARDRDNAGAARATPQKANGKEAPATDRSQPAGHGSEGAATTPVGKKQDSKKTG